MHAVLLFTWLAASTPGEARTLDEFLVIDRSGERIEGHGGSLTEAGFTGLSAEGRQVHLLPDDIQTLYRKEGSRAGVTALCGGAIGLVLSSSTLLMAYYDSPGLFRGSTGLRVTAATVGGSTLLGALIGLAIGAGSSRWSVEPLIAPRQQYSLLVSHSL